MDIRRFIGVLVALSLLGVLLAHRGDSAVSPASALPFSGVLTNDPKHDGVPTLSDNCPVHHDPSQLDSDNDGIGNSCDEDEDGAGPVAF